MLARLDTLPELGVFTSPATGRRGVVVSWHYKKQVRWSAQVMFAGHGKKWVRADAPVLVSARHGLVNKDHQRGDTGDTFLDWSNQDGRDTWSMHRGPDNDGEFEAPEYRLAVDIPNHPSSHEQDSETAKLSSGYRTVRRLAFAVMRWIGRVRSDAPSAWFEGDSILSFLEDTLKQSKREPREAIKVENGRIPDVLPTLASIVNRVLDGTLGTAEANAATKAIWVMLHHQGNGA